MDVAKGHRGPLTWCEPAKRRAKHGTHVDEVGRRPIGYGLVDVIEGKLDSTQEAPATRRTKTVPHRYPSDPGVEALRVLEPRQPAQDVEGNVLRGIRCRIPVPEDRHRDRHRDPPGSPDDRLTR